MISVLRRLTLLGLLAVAPAALAVFSKPALDRSLFGIPPGEWSYVRQGPQGPESYSIPSQLSKVRQLPEPERSEALRAIRERRDNLSFLDRSIDRFFARLKRVRASAAPAYRQELGEAMIAVDNELATTANPLYPHEPVLRALPEYTRLVVMTPKGARDKVEARLAALGLKARARVVVSTEPGGKGFGRDTTRWTRDLSLPARDPGHTLLLTGLAFRVSENVVDNDLGYLTRAADRRHLIPRLPVFFRGGNLAIGERGRRLLFIGSDELQRNDKAFVEAFGFSPLPETMPEILRAASGADQAIILPNTPSLFHIDMYLSFLDEGTVALLAPVDPEHLPPADQAALVRARETLGALGFSIVSVPTSAERIARFQSPANSVVYTERGSGKRRALVPQFPAATAAAAELNARALDAYRQAGIDAIPVEDRFFTRFGNTHCALLVLQ